MIEVKDNYYSCPICGALKLSKLEFETWTSRVGESGSEFLLRCESCGLIFSVPLPTVNYNENFYERKKLLGGSSGGDTKPRPHIIERLNSVEKYFKFKTSLDILDIGCSTGVFLEHARERGHNVKGIEVSEYAANVALSKKLDVFVGEVEDANIANKSIDFIHMNHVLEHLSNPLSTLIFLKHLLRDSGLLIVEVPNEFENLNYKIKRHLTPRILIRTVPTEHSYFFNPKSLSYLFSVAGYKILQITTPSRIKTRVPLVQIVVYLQDRLLLGNNIEVWGIPQT